MTSPDRFRRALYNSVRVDVRIALTAGSAAWSLAGRGGLLRPEHGVGRRPGIALGDRALPIVNRN